GAHIVTRPTLAKTPTHRSGPLAPTPRNENAHSYRPELRIICRRTFVRSRCFDNLLLDPCVGGRSYFLAQSCHDHQRDCNVKACAAPKVFGLAEEAGRGFVTL